MANTIQAIANAQPTAPKSFKAFRTSQYRKAIAFCAKRPSSKVRIVQYGTDPRDRRIVINYCN